MFAYIVRRLVQSIPTVFFISIVSFTIINLPPGDFLTSYVAQLREMGDEVTESELAALEQRYGLNQPIYVQYFKWAGGILVGDFGFSFQWNRPVATLIGERLLLTLAVALSTMLFTWVVAFFIGLYSATHQYSVGDYVATFFGFLGLAIPNFLLALVLMWLAYEFFGQSVGGLFSPEFARAPWSIAKFIDMLRHMWIPVVVIGTAGTAGLIRILRANLLDELSKPYVDTARSKGLKENVIVVKYALRVALIPFVATAGWLLPAIISGSIITSIVLSLPTTGPLLYGALMSQDMYLAGTLIFFISVLTVIGTLISDILLAVIDPRIKYG